MIWFALMIAAQAKPAAAPKSAPPAASCADCHKTSDWRSVTFAHEKTGFPLAGVHQKLSCSDCHVRGIDTPLAAACASCHKDPHAGTLGMHCESCHDDQSFRSTFTADAHRRANFPLTGKHAVIPCEQCHGPARERVFSRTAVACVECHQLDYDNTAARTIDHAAAGYALECRQCHGVARFSPALFPEHDRCFQLLGSVHGATACRQCHSALAGATPSGTCATNTAACSGCHTHACARTDAQHRSVPGYQCKDRKCYECHQFSR